MFQSRDEIRRIYLNVWNKLQQGEILEPMEAIIAEVIELHPEYHPLLQQGPDIQHAEFTPESGASNPFLHMGMHITLREQAAADRPQGIRALHQKLCEKLGPHDAEHAMMECLGQVLWQAQRSNLAPDEVAYIDCLKKI